MLIVANLVWKVAATALVVLIVSRVAQRSGPFLASVVIGLPVAAGPGFFFLALEHDAAFIAQGALACFATTGLVLVFTAAYVQMARRFGYLGCILGASGAWALGAAILDLVPLSLEVAFAGVAVGAAIVWLLRRPFDLHSPKVPIRSGWFLLALRAGTAGLVVGTIATAGGYLGPDLSGFLLGYPVMLTVTSWVLHSQFGGEFAAATLTGFQRTVTSFASFSLVLHLLTGPLSPFLAWGAAILVSATVAGTMAAVRRYM